MHLALISSGLAARELFLDAVARRASPLAGLEIGDDGLDERVRPGIRSGLHQRSAAGEALFEKAPEPARVRRRDGDARHHHAFKNKLPLVDGVSLSRQASTRRV